MSQLSIKTGNLDDEKNLFKFMNELSITPKKNYM